MFTSLRNAWRPSRTRRVDVCETCATACDATCRAAAAREAAVTRMLAAGFWR